MLPAPEPASKSYSTRPSAPDAPPDASPASGEAPPLATRGAVFLTRRRLFLLAAGLLILMAGGLGATLWRAALAGRRVLVATADIPRGGFLLYGNATLRPLEPGESFEGLIAPSDADFHIGRVASRRLKRGEPIPAAVSRRAPKPKMAGSLAPRVAPGLRALVFPTETISSASEKLKPGDFCEVLFHVDAPPGWRPKKPANAEPSSPETPDADPADAALASPARASFRLPEPVRVLAVLPDEPDSPGGGVVLELTPEEASLASFALFATSRARSIDTDAPPKPIATLLWAKAPEEKRKGEEKAR
jgi:Flp pilus assembly protein CpaB